MSNKGKLYSNNDDLDLDANNVGWVVARMQPVHYRVKQKRGLRKPVDMISKPLHFCESCNVVWESIASSEQYIERYQDFPTRGLKRKKCLYCNRKENNED